MGRPLRVLFVEDVEADARLVLRELQRGGFEVTHERVETREAMDAALTRTAWDVVICDHSMPRFSAPQALALLQSRKLDLPFIIVSGTVNEEIAIESLRAGAGDFLAKGRLARLNPAIDRELRDVALRAEQAKLEEHLMIADRMASVGTLAAGVGHEINNPLAALVANVDFALDSVTALAQAVRVRAAERSQDGAVDEDLHDHGVLASLDAIQEPLRDARDSADRIRRIVRDLKVFSRSEDEQTGPVDVRRVLESAARMAWNEVRHRARLVKDFRDVPQVEANEGRLGQVFLNLVVNAAQAIPEGSAEKNEVRIATRVESDGRVVVEVSDTGSGILEANLSRIFDPFFTTKPIGAGTGLGLAISHRLITALGGELSVQSTVGVGSVFRVTLLPAKQRAVESAAPPMQVGPTRRGRVLVVDDEPTLGSVIRRVLASLHDVTVVTSGRDAIDRIARGERFDVILCDLMMPDVTGMDLHAELVRTANDQAEKIVFMTGGAFTTRAREFLAQVSSPRLEKPVDAATIRGIVQSMLVAK